MQGGYHPQGYHPQVHITPEVRSAGRRACRSHSDHGGAGHGLGVFGGSRGVCLSLSPCNSKERPLIAHGLEPKRE